MGWIEIENPVIFFWVLVSVLLYFLDKKIQKEKNSITKKTTNYESERMERSKFVL